MIQRVRSAIGEYGYIFVVVWLIALFLSITIYQLPIPLVYQAITTPLFQPLALIGSISSLLLGILSALALVVRDITIIVSLVAICGSIGSILTRRWLGEGTVALPAIHALLGLGLLSLLALFLGLIGIFPSRTTAYVAIMVVILMSLTSIRAWLKSFCDSIKEIFHCPSTRFDRYVRASVVILIGLAVLISIAPPTKWDALTYHLEAPRYYLQVGRIAAFPENHFFGFPQLMEMLYLWVMLVARPEATGLLHAAFGILGLLCVAGLCQRAGNLSLIWLAAAIMLVGQSMWVEWGIPYNDLAILAYTTAALVAVMVSQESGQPDQAWLAVSGVCVGFAMSTKYTAASSAVGIGVLVWFLIQKRGLRTVLAVGGMVSISALIVFSPWLLKNALLTGSPVFPFFFSTPAFDQFDQQYYLRPGTGLDAVSVILAPIQGAVFGKEGLAPYGSSMGSLLLPLLPLSFIGWSNRSEAERTTISALTVFAVPAYLIWLSGAATSWFLVQTRLLFPIFPALAVVAALGVAGLGKTKLRINLSTIVHSVVMVALGIAILSSAATAKLANTMPVTFALQAPEAYLEQSLGTYYAAMKVVNKLPPESKVRFLWEPRMYYCEIDCLPDSMINQWWHDRQIEPDPYKIAERWRANGVTHVLIFEDGLKFLITEEPYELMDQSDVDALNTLRAAELQPVAEMTSYTLYEWKSR